MQNRKGAFTYIPPFDKYRKVRIVSQQKPMMVDEGQADDVPFIVSKELMNSDERSNN